ncbi:PIR protein [Plasmodium vivax]|nr:PIR protein [Plasmodium vivax]
MTSTISINELPSVKFEKEIKDLMNYTKLEKYDRGKTESDEIDRWIEAFQLKVEAYLKDSSNNLSLNNDKHCKHFNYLISTMINKVNSLSSKLGKKLEWSSKIKECRDKFFLSNNNEMCKESNAYDDSIYKDLGNFCEDSVFIKENIVEIQNSDNCQSIFEYMSTIRDRLQSFHEHQRKRGGIIPEIDNTCNTKNLDDILPSITCNSSVQHQSQLEEPSLVVKLDDIGLPIFGVLGCSFLFYKFTPVGSIFRSRIQNKGIIPINKDDYSTNEVLPNIPNTNDIYSENAQYKISYQTL